MAQLKVAEVLLENIGIKSANRMKKSLFELFKK